MDDNRCSNNANNNRHARRRQNLHNHNNGPDAAGVAEEPKFNFSYNYITYLFLKIYWITYLITSMFFALPFVIATFFSCYIICHLTPMHYLVHLTISLCIMLDLR